MKRFEVQRSEHEAVAHSFQTIASVFRQGLTFADFVTSMRIHQQETIEHYQQLRFSDQQRQLVKKTISRELLALVITEDWCPDSLWNLPVLIRMAEVARNLNVRIVRRINFPELAANYPGKDGKNHIPTFIFFNEKEGVIGWWSERSAQQLEWVTKFFRQHSRPSILLRDNLPEPEFREWIKLRIEHERKIFQESLWVATLYELVALIKTTLTEKSCESISEEGKVILKEHGTDAFSD